MVAYYLYFIAAIGIIAIVHSYDCPNLCACLGTYVDCSKKGLTKMPKNLPVWINELEFSNNILSEDISRPLLKLPSLIKLKLNKNLLKSFPHLHLPMLRKLSLSHNEISNLSYEIMEDLPAMEDLDLSYNQIERLEKLIFPTQNKLLTLNLNNNQIKLLESHSFMNLGLLKELKLNHNRILNLKKGSFSNLYSLKVLELNHNQLKEISGLVFHDLSNLTSLKLRRNHINEIKDGAFYGTKLLHLQLDYNFITAVHKAGFYGLSNLTTLSLSHNSISNIENDVWEFCKSVQELDLSYNNILGINKGTLEHMSNLLKLNIQNNHISLIEENAFSFTPKLMVLELGNNKISWTIEDQIGPFIGLNILQKLFLGSNNIKSIGSNALLGLHSLIELDLSNNNITSIYENAFSSMHNIQQLHINTSSLLCDCHLQWFNIWLQEHQRINGIEINCFYPIMMRGKSFKTLPAENFTCYDSPKPEIIVQPKSKMVLKGENVSLICKASSSTNASLTFSWKRDNFDIKNTETTEFGRSPDGKMSEELSELKLYNVNHDDAGKYQCIVENAYGKVYSTRSRIIVVTFPRFEKIPLNITVKSGSTARLECAATGQPLPQIAWQKDGGNDFPAARERRMHVMPTDDVFFITNVKTVDMGIYSCTARNPAGIIVVNATLTIEETPSFIKPMENKEVTVGDPIVLECMASGSPKPFLQWMKDGEPIKVTERHFFTADGQLLIIMDTVLSDAGTYICEITNSAGAKQGTTNLHINPIVSAVDNYMIGVIIISVVCCAVGTSVGWVVIIYHIRKRLKKHQIVEEISPALVEEAGTTIYTDTVSDRSSCKDSGTGDSAKRSNEHLPSDEFSISKLEHSTEEREHDNRETKYCMISPTSSQYRYTNHRRLSGNTISSPGLRD